MGGTFVCEECGGEFAKGWTDGEAAVELAENFGDVALEDCAEVCDDCYAEIVWRKREAERELNWAYIQYFLDGLARGCFATVGRRR